MLFKSLLICLLLVPKIQHQEHKFYLSLTDIVYDEEEKRLKITCDVFVDDIQELLEKRYQKDFLLVEGDEYRYTKKYIKKYLADKFSIRLKGAQQQIKYLGKEYQIDKLRFYLYVENVEPFDKVAISNKILMDLFDDQKNMVHVNNGEKTKTLLLEKGRSNGVLKF